MKNKKGKRSRAFHHGGGWFRYFFGRKPKSSFKSSFKSSVKSSDPTSSSASKSKTRTRWNPFKKSFFFSRKKRDKSVNDIKVDTPGLFVLSPKNVTVVSKESNIPNSAVRVEAKVYPKNSNKNKSASKSKSASKTRSRMNTLKSMFSRTKKPQNNPIQNIATNSSQKTSQKTSQKKSVKGNTNL